MYGSKLQAYKKTHKLTQSGRELEASVLMQAAQKISDCKDNWNAPDQVARLDSALTYNQRVWSILQGELVKEDNPLPKKIREDLLSLSVFVDKRTYEIRAYPSPDKLKILIDINLNIAAGLSAKPPQE